MHRPSPFGCARPSSSSRAPVPSRCYCSARWSHAAGFSSIETSFRRLQNNRDHSRLMSIFQIFSDLLFFRRKCPQLRGKKYAIHYVGAFGSSICVIAMICFEKELQWWDFFDREEFTVCERGKEGSSTSTRALQ